MIIEIPWDAIKQVQISLREEGKVSSYDPDDLSLLNLPSAKESISELDPSPPYLRCKHCKARLLRGIESLNCVFCGEQQRTTDNPPEPIKFTSTVGYNWFLRSLNLDGSELVGPSVETHDLIIEQNDQLEEVPLSELLDLEIQWFPEEEKKTGGFSYEESDQNISSAKFVGADLDNFFPERAGAAASAPPEVKLQEHKLNEETKNNIFQGHGGLSLFENDLQQHERTNSVEKNDDLRNSAFHGRENLSLFESAQPSETAVVRPAEDQAWDSSFGWNSQFQSSGATNLHQESKSVDPFLGPDLSDHLDTLGSGKDLSDGRAQNFQQTSLSKTDDWFPDGVWSTLKPVTHHTQQTDVTSELKNVGPTENSNDLSSTNIDWVQDSPWQTITKETPDKLTPEDDDDSFGAWSDFKTSNNAQDPFTSSFQQAQDPFARSFEQSGATFEFENFDQNSNIKDGRLQENVTSTSPLSTDWIQDDQSKVSSSIAPENKTNEQENDMFDDWNDFTSSTNAQVPASIVVDQASKAMTPSFEQTSEKNMYTATNDPQYIDFSSATQTDLFSGAFNIQNGSLEVKNVLAEASTSPENKIDYQEDSFDYWNDFTSSPASRVVEQASEGMTPSIEQTSEINLYTSSNNPHYTDFSNSQQTQVLSGALNHQNGSSEVKNVQLEDSTSLRMRNVAARDGGSGEQIVQSDMFPATEESKSDVVERLMSQMHDLSFMLERNLSVPHK